MNLSRWQTYDKTERTRILSEIGSLVRNRVMPPRRYLLLHAGARLSQGEVDEIYRWTIAARRRLNGSPPE